MLTPDGWAFSHFFEGPYVASTERVLRQAESMPQPYQPRLLLGSPELYMLTLWLHGDCIRVTLPPGHPAATDPAGAAGHRPRPASRRTGRTGSPNCCRSSRTG